MKKRTPIVEVVQYNAWFFVQYVKNENSKKYD